MSPLSPSGVRPGLPYTPSLPTCALALLLLAQGAATQTYDDVVAALEKALARIDTLETRVATLEGRQLTPEEELEAQLEALIVKPPQARSQTVFPSALNPTIGVFTDAVVEGGNAQEKLGEDGDRFSLRETEIDFRLPIAPFAEGVLVAVFEDAGSGEFESLIEEGYADVNVGALLDVDTAAKAKVGRFRLPFGHDNKLHTHDLVQVDRSFAVTQQLGEEGLIGDGFEFSLPVCHVEGEDGLAGTTTAQIALVNGELFRGEESLLGALAEDAGLELDSDAPVLAARLSHYSELTPLSDVEVGASYLRNLGSQAVMTDAGTDIEPTLYGLDATLRSRDDEHGVGSWLLSGEIIHTLLDYGSPTMPGFPAGHESTRGWAVTAQRQTSPTTYVGLRLGKSDILGSDSDVADVSPYVSWYADEFFRIRLQGQHLKLDGDGGDTNVNRAFAQFTWNFGAHQPHPYWVNR